jgi:hypothetical protein
METDRYTAPEPAVAALLDRLDAQLIEAVAAWLAADPSRTIQDLAAYLAAHGDLPDSLRQAAADGDAGPRRARDRPGGVRGVAEERATYDAGGPEGTSGTEGAGAGGRPRRRPEGVRALPARLVQQTSPEAKALAVGLADGPKLRRWRPLEGDTALLHQAEKSLLMTLLKGTPLLDWLGLPNSVDSLREELRRAGLPAVLLMHVLIGGSLELAERGRLYVTVAVDDLVGAIGWRPRSTAEREGMRRRVWRWLALYDACEIIGRRAGRYRDPDTRELIDLVSRDALIRITGRRLPAQLAFDDSAAPLEVTYAAGPWIEKFKGNRAILSYFAVDVRRVAAIPAGKPSGAWAQAIGLALHQKWRERAAYADVAHVGEDKSATVRVGTFTRRDLLDLFPPEPTVDDVLKGHTPGRARDYWREAIGLLKQHGLIGHYKELGTAPTQRQGWQDAWLTQPLDIRPTDDGREAVAEIADRAKEVRERGRRRRAARNAHEARDDVA